MGIFTCLKSRKAVARSNTPRVFAASEAIEEEKVKLILQVDEAHTA